MMMNRSHFKNSFSCNLNEITCTITDTASKTNRPPVIAKTISCLVIIPTAPNDPPSDKDPVSPINILAGGALNHKKPRQDPIIAPKKTVTLQHLLYMEFVNTLKRLCFQ